MSDTEKSMKEEREMEREAKGEECESDTAEMAGMGHCFQLCNRFNKYTRM